MPRKFWLMKCEPSAYSIDDLERDRSTSWEGVRNHQARNFMRDEMKKGDRVLFYASNADPSGVAGLAEIVREAYPDSFAWKKGHEYFDERSRKDNPRWFLVDVGFVEKFPEIVPLADLKNNPRLSTMGVVRKGNRLSIQPVTREEYDEVVRMGRKKKASKRAR